MKYLYLMIMSVLPIMFTLSCSSEKTNLVITEVHDGDTVTSSEGEKFRIFGVDTPEVSSSGGNRRNKETGLIETVWKPTTGIEALYGELATRAAKHLLLGKNAHIIRITKGKYGRTVARVVRNNIDLGLMLVRKGLARVAYVSLEPKNPYYTSNVNYYGKLLMAEYEAAKNEIGFWKDKDRFKEIFPKS